MSELKIRQVRKLFNTGQLGHLKDEDKMKVISERAKNDSFLHSIRNKLKSKKNAKNEDLLEQLSYGLERQSVINEASQTGIFEDPNPFVKPGRKIYKIFIFNFRVNSK